MSFQPNATIKTKRIAGKEINEDREAYPATYTLEGVACWIEPDDPYNIAMVEQSSAFNAFLICIDQNIDIRKGDLIIDDEGVEYYARGVQSFKGENYMEITALKDYF